MVLQSHSFVIIRYNNMINNHLLGLDVSNKAVTCNLKFCFNHIIVIGEHQKRIDILNQLFDSFNSLQKDVNCHVSGKRRYKQTGEHGIANLKFLSGRNCKGIVTYRLLFFVGTRVTLS